MFRGGHLALLEEVARGEAAGETAAEIAEQGAGLLGEIGAAPGAGVRHEDPAGPVGKAFDDGGSACE